SQLEHTKGRNLRSFTAFVLSVLSFVMEMRSVVVVVVVVVNIIFNLVQKSLSESIFRISLKLRIRC
ncbi:hypothetical protein Tco_0094031, partial [Tanacetum coccineum]